MQKTRWRLWAPVAFGIGCAIYFASPSEPARWLVYGGALFASALWLAARRLGAGRAVSVPLMLAACAALGLGAAAARADRVASPIAPVSSDPTVITGWVVDVDSPGARGSRVVLAPVRVRGLEPDAVPHRVRVTVRGAPPSPGTAIEVFALLGPPPPPPSPGAYDFARANYFQSVGGLGFGLGEARSVTLAEPPWALKMRMQVNAVRYRLGLRIVERLGERSGGIAAAMVTGHRVWTASEDIDAMRDSGLAHLLAISGLHMMIVGGFAFFFARLLIAAIPPLALRVNGKKLAAVFGLMAVGTYLIISGGPPPAERAATTASVAFVAILLDRRAISMNALAIAAFVVLALRPESIVQPGFQMSFAATAALVALAESWPRRIKEISAPALLATLQKARSWLLATVAASLVAGLATGPMAMQHFNRMAVYGLLANVASAPVTSFMMMPALALGAALEPLGLGGPFLIVAGWGVEIMLAVGHYASSLPGAVSAIPSAPVLALPVAFVGILWVCIWRGWGRVLGVPFAAAVILWPRPAVPDLWIDASGTQGAWRDGTQVQLVRQRVRRFPADMWSQRRGLTISPHAEGTFSCTRFSCRPVTAEAAPLAIWWGRREPDRAALESLCATAEVVAVRVVLPSLPEDCEGALVLDGADFARGGAVELWRDGAGGWRALWAEDVRGRRPWSSALSDSGG